MNKIGLLGCGQLGKKFNSLLVKQGITLEAVADNNKVGECFDEKKVIDVRTLFQKYINKDLDMIVIAIMSDRERTEVAIQLLDLGIDANNIFFVPEWINVFPEEEISDVKKELIPMKEMKPTLNWLDIPVVDYCNLNCKGCWMACNLVEKGTAGDIERYESDMKRLTKLYGNIEEIHFMGGEPLADEQRLKRCIEVAHECFPRAALFITTNGLLIEQLSDEIWDFLKKNDVMIAISYYPILSDKIYNITKLTYDHNVKLYISEKKEKFLKRFSWDVGDVEEARKDCPNKHAHYLYNGRIYVCGFPITLERLNQIVDIPWYRKDVGYDIYDKLDGWDITSALNRPYEYCEHCCANMEEIDWKSVGKNIDISDWFIQGKCCRE